MIFVGVALLVLGCILVCYILLLRYRAAQLRRTLREEQDDEGSLSEAGHERGSWWRIDD
jgi:hypothetical protein